MSNFRIVFIQSSSILIFVGLLYLFDIQPAYLNIVFACSVVCISAAAVDWIKENC